MREGGQPNGLVGATAVHHDGHHGGAGIACRGIGSGIQAVGHVGHVARIDNVDFDDAYYLVCGG